MKTEIRICTVETFDMKKFVEDVDFLLKQKLIDVQFLPRKKKKAAKKRIFKEMSCYINRVVEKNFAVKEFREDT